MNVELREFEGDEFIREEEFARRAVQREEERVRAERLAREHLKRFFGGKKLYCGGPIPQALMFSRESVEFLLHTEFDPGIEYCYEVVTPQLREPDFDLPSLIPWDVGEVLALRKQAGAAKIPVTYQAGAILLAFKFCYGCQVSRADYLDWLVARPVAA